MAIDTSTTKDTKEKRGGRRANAGRKKASHTIQSELFRKRLIEKITAKQDPIIDKLLDRALSGSEKALEMVLERIIGRPITPLDHQGEGLEALTNMITQILTGKKQEKKN